MIREPEGKKVLQTDNLTAAPTNADRVKMDTQKGSGANDNPGPFSSANSTILVSAPKPLASYMGSRSFLQTKIPSFYIHIYTHQYH